MRESVPQKATERVLPTLNEDGSRRWLSPRPSPGRFLSARRIVAYGLIALFTFIPYFELGGKPIVLLDIAARRFTLFGTTYYATDTVLLLTLLLTLFLAIFLLTALYGRVWCGWACPQTVYLEFLFRPLERWIVGAPREAEARTRTARRARRALLFLVYFGASFYLAHTFLAYFVGVENLKEWVLGSPADHPVAFGVVAGTTLLMLFNFGYFREQTCLVACPYGRFQSVLLDRRSLIVGYDGQRGEPRGKLLREGAVLPEGQSRGDCVDCKLCVVTCPTGIDIRDGLQMECIHCTQCIDACDGVMEKIGKPRGLIRYTSQEELAGAPRRFLRWRTVLYPVLLAGAFGAFVALVATRPLAEVTLLRGKGAPFTRTPDGEVTNQMRIKIANHGGQAAEFHITMASAANARLITPQNPLRVPAGDTRETSAFVLAAERSFLGGQRRIELRVSAGAGLAFESRKQFLLLGPK
jgi:cytochrome c oxidase accessory protein FixG